MPGVWPRSQAWAPAMRTVAKLPRALSDMLLGARQVLDGDLEGLARSMSAAAALRRDGLRFRWRRACGPGTWWPRTRRSRLGRGR